MRMPTRLHITWDNDNTLQASRPTPGSKRVSFISTAPPPAGGAPIVAGIFRRELGRFEAARICSAGSRRSAAARAQPQEGYLKVVTTDLNAGIPAQERSSLRRKSDRRGIFRQLHGAHGNTWLDRNVHRHRSRVSGSILPHKLAIQEASRCDGLESHAVRSEVNHSRNRLADRRNLPEDDGCLSLVFSSGSPTRNSAYLCANRRGANQSWNRFTS